MKNQTDKDIETSNEMKTVAVQIKLLPKTIEKIENLKIEFDTNNRTNIIVRGIKILEYIVNERNKGNELIILEKDGSKKRLDLLM